ncbi:hypothetical protein RQP46_002666 [Phenoliferia psychrophenolica]
MQHTWSPGGGAGTGGPSPGSGSSGTPSGAPWGRGGGGGGGNGNGESGAMVPKFENFDDGDDDDDEGSAAGDGPPEGGKDGETAKKKSTRGSRACTVCRKLKMRCIGAEEGLGPCKRCKSAGHEESMRGRRTNRKTDAMAKSLKKMEATLETVLKSISQPGLLSSAGGLSNPTLQQLTSPHDSNPRPRSESAGPVASPSGTAGHHLSMNAHGMPGGHQTEGPRADFGGGGADVRWRGGVRTSEERAQEPRLHSLPDNVLNPLGLLAEASLQNTRKRTSMTLNEVLDTSRGAVDDGDTHPDRKRTKLGVANAGYFQPGPMNTVLPLRRIVIEHRMPPALLIEKIVSIEEVVELFALFFEHCHRSCPILDPEVHTPTATGSRSPFLFTCICSVAARYYTKRTDDLYRKCLRVAKRVAFDVMTKGFKSTEICQGFLLLCQWNQPAERFEEERTYQFSGIAIRMATDLNLHRKTLAVLPEETPDETRTLYEREIMNRERTWLYSFIADRSVSTQMGKPYSIPKEDFIIRNAKTWFQAPGAQKTDVGLSAMVEMHRIVGRIIDTLYSDTRSVSGLNAHLDYTLLMRSFLGQLDQWRMDWSVVIPPDGGDGSDVLRSHMRDYYHSYYRLFLLSFAVQHALDNEDSNIDLASYCVLCFESAQSIITIARDHLGPCGALRFGIDSTYVYLSYAATFLLKLINPTFSSLVDASVSLSLVRDAADTLERCAVDDTHTPALYASFLRALIENKRTGGRTAPGSRVGTQPNSPVLGPVGIENFIKSRAGSAAPGEGVFAPMGEGDSNDFTAFDSVAMDSMLSNGGFWDNMLMPGFGGPLQGLSGGTGMMLGGATDPWSMTPRGELEELRLADLRLESMVPVKELEDAYRTLDIDKWASPDDVVTRVETVYLKSPTSLDPKVAGAVFLLASATELDPILTTLHAHELELLSAKIYKPFGIEPKKEERDKPPHHVWPREDAATQTAVVRPSSPAPGVDQILKAVASNTDAIQNLTQAQIAGSREISESYRDYAEEFEHINANLRSNKQQNELERQKHEINHLRAELASLHKGSEDYQKRVTEHQTRQTAELEKAQTLRNEAQALRDEVLRLRVENENLKIISSGSSQPDETLSTTSSERASFGGSSVENNAFKYKLKEVESRCSEKVAWLEKALVTAVNDAERERKTNDERKQWWINVAEPRMNSDKKRIAELEKANEMLRQGLGALRPRDPSPRAPTTSKSSTRMPVLSLPSWDVEEMGQFWHTPHSP